MNATTPPSNRVPSTARQPTEPRLALRRRYRRVARRGQALVEFAIVAMIFCMLLAGMVSFGLILLKANVTQQAADVAAQELSRTALNPVNQINPGNENSYLDDVLYADVTNASTPYQAVRQQLFDEKYLYVAVANMTTDSLSSESANWPLINRLLVPAMVYDVDAKAYRYPGAIVTNNTTGATTVLVPLVTGRDPNTWVETIEWHRPVEEVKFPNSSNAPTAGQFSLAATDPNGSSGTTSFTPGVVAIRIYCPVQTPMVGYQPNPGNAQSSQTLTNIEYQIEASDAAVSVSDPSGLMGTYTPVVAADSGHGTTEGGEYGMGSFYYSGPPMARPITIVRPFRKVVVSQGVYRREVFGP